MFKKIKEFFTGKPAVEAPVAEVPYKVETPVAVGEPPATVVAVAEGAGIVEVPAKTKKARAPAKPKAEKAPATKAPRKPRAPKAAK